VAEAVTDGYLRRMDRRQSAVKIEEKEIWCAALFLAFVISLSLGLAFLFS
jgi:hypothetical protein